MEVDPIEDDNEKFTDAASIESLIKFPISNYKFEFTLPYTYKFYQTSTNVLIECTLEKISKKFLHFVSTSGKKHYKCKNEEWCILEWDTDISYKVVIESTGGYKKVTKKYKIERIVSLKPISNKSQSGCIGLGTLFDDDLKLLSFLCKHIHNFGKINGRSTKGNDLESLKIIFNKGEFLCWSQADLECYNKLELTHFNEISIDQYKQLLDSIGYAEENNIVWEAINLYQKVKTKLQESRGYYILKGNIIRTNENEALNYLLKRKVLSLIDNDKIYITKFLLQEILIRKLLIEGVELITGLGFSKPKNLCSEQFQAFDLLERNYVTIINGAAGSGKTEVMRRLIECTTLPCIILTYQGQNIYNIENLISNESRKRCAFYTFHYFISNFTIVMEQIFKYKGVISMPFYVLVDETTLVTPELLCNVLYLFNINDLHAYRWLFCGDLNQLSPMGSGNLFYDLCKVLPEQVIKFEHNHRIKYKPICYIEPLFHAILGKPNSHIISGPVPPLNEKLFDNNHTNFYFKLGEDKKNLKQIINYIFDHYKLDLRNSHVITRLNEDVNLLNQIISKKFLDTNTFVKGSKILFKKNFYETDIRTNVVYIIERITMIYSSDIQFDVEEEIDELLFKDVKSSKIILYLYAISTKKHFYLKMLWKYWKYIHLGYASTIHGTLGQQFDNIIYLQSKNSPYETMQTIYTAFSRSKWRRFFIGSITNLQSASKKLEPLRLTGLGFNPIKSDELDLEDYDLIETSGLLMKNEIELSKSFNPNFDSKLLIKDIIELITLFVLDNNKHLHWNIRNLISCASVNKQWRLIINHSKVIWKNFLFINSILNAPESNYLDWIFKSKDTCLPIFKLDLGKLLFCSHYIYFIDKFISDNFDDLISIRPLENSLFILNKCFLNDSEESIFCYIDKLIICIKTSGNVYLQSIMIAESKFDRVLQLVNKDNEIELTICSSNSDNKKKSKRKYNQNPFINFKKNKH